MKKKKARILLYDIETAPNLAYVWGKYEQNVLEYQREWSLLCFSYKWLGEKTTKCVSLLDFTDAGSNRRDEYVVKALWDLLNQADIVIAHNGDQFDNKKMNARFITLGMNPVAPYRSIDTKKVAKQYFNFNGNSLNDLSRTFKIGKKLPGMSFDVWLGCMKYDKASWKKMIKYNKHDVNLL